MIIRKLVTVRIAYPGVSAANEFLKMGETILVRIFDGVGRFCGVQPVGVFPAVRHAIVVGVGGERIGVNPPRGRDGRVNGGGPHPHGEGFIKGLIPVG
ncbi:MAG: hypothetical protein KBF76_20470, partial [Verrucomicrobiales bacterium]|nr:hypothetical protein [Verrucomicrobiales bacterium]